jgi:Cytochrome P460
MVCWILRHNQGVFMRIGPFLCLALVLSLHPLNSTAGNANKRGLATSSLPSYTSDGRMQFPSNYREWIFLSSDLDMSYTPSSDMGGMRTDSAFGNVFVNPEAYRAFRTTGIWPDKTMLVLEHHRAGSNASINKAGHFQADALPEIEVHVKDSRFVGRWAFFSFGDGQPATEIKHSASCYSCHHQHGATDTTFVQFYPTLIDIAKAKGTYAAK